MITLRERIERGTYGDYLEVKNYVDVLGDSDPPYCCFESKVFYSSIGKRIELYKCSYLKKWYTLNGFKRQCKKCMEEIKGLLSEWSVKEEEPYCLRMGH